MTLLEITFVGQDTTDPIMNSGLIPPKKLQEAVQNGRESPCSVSSRVLTVSQGSQVVTTTEDFEYEANAATGSLYTLAALHKAGIIKISSLNGVQIG
jgi:hypothetical protein